MNIIMSLFDFILNIDVHLGQIISTYGTATYAILFAIIFMETGVVFTPFLPGDSLLFAAGAFAALGSLHIGLLCLVLIAAAILGDTTNYWIGYFFGEKIIAHPKIPINQKHIDETHTFFKKYGGKTIILARFVPFVRTFAPFVAGIGKMHYSTFITYNVIGALMWGGLATLAGYFFGNIQFVKDNFSLVIIVIVLISIIPMVVPLIQHRVKQRK